MNGGLKGIPFWPYPQNGGGAFHAIASDFEITANEHAFLLHSDPLTDFDTHYFIFSFWYNVTQSGTISEDIMEIFKAEGGTSAAPVIDFFYDKPLDRFVFTAREDNIPSPIIKDYLFDVPFEYGWHHFIFTMGPSLNDVKAYYDGAPVSVTEDANTGAQIPFSSSVKFRIVPNPFNDVSDALPVCLSEFYLAAGSWVDLDTEISKFISDGKPVDLGRYGQKPTGSVPTVYFRDVMDTDTNLGTAGSFDFKYGDITECATSPSD